MAKYKKKKDSKAFQVLVQVLFGLLAVILGLIKGISDGIGPPPGYRHN